MHENFGENLRFWRKRLAFSQNELAKRSGVSPVTIGQIETGKRRARRETINKLVEGLGITENQLMGNIKELNKDPASLVAAIEQATAEGARSTSTQSSAPQGVPIVLSNLDLEIINRVLNLDFDNKINVLKHLKSFEM
jgi:transcriptional regulator with XRE-family HTH domain